MIRKTITEKFNALCHLLLPFLRFIYFTLFQSSSTHPYAEQSKRLKQIVLLGLVIGPLISTRLSADGLTGKYYNNRSFADPLVMSRVDSTIDFDWGTGNPGDRVHNDNFSVKWTGYIYFPEGAKYTFGLYHDDGMKLTIDGTEIYSYNSWSAWQYRESKEEYFSSGCYPIELTLIEKYGGASAKMRWKNNAGMDWQTVPEENLFTDSSLCPATVPSVSISDASATEKHSGTSTLDFTITLDFPAPSGGISIDYETKDGTAKTADNDYESTTGTLNIAEGETKGIITILIKGDTNVEEDETFTMILSNPNNAIIENSIATGTILNDDTPIPPLNICEGMFPGPLNNVDPSQSGKKPGILFDGNEKITGTIPEGYVITDADTKDFVNGKGETCDNNTPCRKTGYWADQYTFTVNGGDGNNGDIEASNLIIDSVKQYNKFKSKENATITFNNNIIIYVKDKIDFKKNTTLNINGNIILVVNGDVKLGINHHINIASNASLRIYASGTIDVGSNASDYTPSHLPEQLALLSKKEIKFGNDNKKSENHLFRGMLYSEGDITLAKSMDFTGTMTASGTIKTNGATIHGSGYCQKCATVGFQQATYHTQEEINNAGKKVYTQTQIILSRPVWYDVTLSYSTLDGTAKVIDGDYLSQTNQLITLKAGETNATLPIAIYNDTPIELTENFFVQLSNPQPSDICLNDNNRTEIIIDAQEDSPVCFEDTFDNGLDDRWRVLKSSGDFTPGIVNVNGDNRLRITPRQHNIATLVTKDYEFETSRNLIIIEFDYYAYGGCEDGGMGTYGADGITNVLFDSTVGNSPSSGAPGGSLGYAQRSGGINGFEGGWLGLGLDEYGNFGNCNEGRIGGLQNTSCDNNNDFSPQDYPNTAVIRGDGNGILGYEFLQGVKLDTPIADRTANDYHSGKYKMTVDARDPAHLYIRLERDTGNGYKVIIDQFDAKDSKYNQGETPAVIRYAISGGTGGGCNNHEIGYIRLKGNCGFYGAPSTTGPFDAWDIFRDDPKNVPTDRNISTKIVKKPFKLALASLNKNTQTYETKPGDQSNVEVALYSAVSNSDNKIVYSKSPLSNIVNFDPKNERHRISDDFLVNNVQPEVAVGFKVCATNENNLTTGEYTYHLRNTSSCRGQEQLYDCNYRTVGHPVWHLCYSLDTFAIRPDKFMIDLKNTTLFKAGKGYPIDYTALDYNSNHANGYSQEQNSSFELISALTTPTTGCQHQHLSIPNTILFENGFHNGNNNKTYLNTVGDFTLTIQEVNGSEFAKVDSDDTPFADDPDKTARFITEANASLHIVPSDYNITATLSSANSQGGFTYLSSSNKMATTLNIQLQALIADGSNAVNYESDCYADDTNLRVTYTLPDITPANALSKLLVYDENNASSVDINSGDFNLTFTKTLFGTDGEGSANINLALNFDRKEDKAVNPFKLTIQDLNLSETDNEVSKQTTVEQSTTFLYARAQATKPLYDNVTQTSVKTPIMVQVYCDKWPASEENCPGIDLLNGYSEPHWWLSLNHNQTAGDGTIALQPGTTTPNGGSASITSVNIISNGIDKSVTVTRGTTTPLPMKVDINLDPINTDPWLIYLSNPFYSVKFIGTMEWAGESQAGHVVDTNISNIKNQKLGW